MDFFFFGGGFEILFSLAFFAVLAVILVTAVRGLLQWNQNNHSPRLTVPAVVAAKRTATTHSHHNTGGAAHVTSSTTYYATFQVESGESYEFKNEEKANIFQSYEFKLWDLKNNTEYEIPDGQYVSVTIPVKEGYKYSIEHLLDNGATETIIPSVNGSTMVFSTHSFSPFGIAGSRQLVGPDAGNDTDDTDAVTPAPASSDSQSSDSGKNNTVSMNDSSDSNNGSSSDQNDNLTENKAVKNNNTVNTGDTTSIMPFVILFVAAAVIAGVVVFIKKRKK